MSLFFRIYISIVLLNLIIAIMNQVHCGAPPLSDTHAGHATGTISGDDTHLDRPMVQCTRKRKQSGVELSTS